MSWSPSNHYHHPRWPLVQHTISCAAWSLVGTGILLAPVGHLSWAGLLPLAYGFGRWIFSVRPRWKHVIILEEDQLRTGGRSYDWNRFDRMEIERNDTHRSIRLTGESGKLDILIKDDLPGFDELSSGCFYHMNRTIEPSDSTTIKRKPDFLSTIETTRN